MNLGELRQAFMDFSPSERRAFLKSLEHSPRTGSSEPGEQRLSGGVSCPRCGGTEGIQKYGTRSGLQRYRCKKCGRLFIEASNAVLFGTHKDISVWETCMICLLEGLSLRKTADRCGISAGTALIWRKKILDALRGRALRA